ncbi:hypothetical protein COB64_03805 [Candidatus Wolfebacteria bacterium]|nr:MAG: hypothetical protein COB64_03805 [Candidatus Wolfebacteria bacterium]
MLLTPQIKYDGHLLLDAYSFSSEEINSVSFVLVKANNNIVTEPLQKDQEGRDGLRYIIVESLIFRLEDLLNLTFELTPDDRTRVTFEETYFNADADGDGASSYKCSKIDTPPRMVARQFLQTMRKRQP